MKIVNLARAPHCPLHNLLKWPYNFRAWKQPSSDGTNTIDIVAKPEKGVCIVYLCSMAGERISRNSWISILCVTSLLILSTAACENGGDCESTADTGVASDATTPSTCTKDKVTCKSGEINAFGVCLPASHMVKVAAGEFTMGYTATGMPYTPEHKVTLKEFYIDKTEVTTAEYAACVACGKCVKPLRDSSHSGREPSYYGNARYKDYPVIHITWKDAKAYCEGIGKRLPTEAEWEKAARGTSKSDYPWGAASPSSSTANFGGVVNDTDKVTACDKGKSHCGALNMAGNVWEWVNDTYDAGYYAKSPKSDPKGPATGTLKVVRGGGFASTRANSRPTTGPSGPRPPP